VPQVIVDQVIVLQIVVIQVVVYSASYKEKKNSMHYLSRYSQTILFAHTALFRPSQVRLFHAAAMLSSLNPPFSFLC
jgi:hypothetical protein